MFTNIIIIIIIIIVVPRITLLLLLLELRGGYICDGLIHYVVTSGGTCDV